MSAAARARLGKIVLPMIVILLVIAIWWIVVVRTESAIFPTPWQVVAGALELARDGTLWEHIGASLFRVGTGFGLALVVAIPLGLNDVMVLRNADTVPHIFGPTLIMPGQSFRLPFVQASTYGFECSAHPNGGLSVIVDPAPAPGWERLLWRWRRLTNMV